MSTANPVLEIGVHIVEKFTSNAGEHIVDGFFQHKDSKFDICSDLARRDPNDHIYEETENDPGVDLFAWKRKRPTIYKSILRCSFIVFLVVLLTGSYFWIVGNLLIFVILKTMLNYNYFCGWIKENTLNTQPVYNMRMWFVLVREFFLDNFMLVILCTVFTWSAVKRSRILAVNALFVITNTSYHVILYVIQKHSTKFVPCPLYILYIFTMLHHSYTMGRKVFPQSRTAALKVSTKLCVHLAATVITSYIMHYAMFPWFLTLHGVPKLFVATIASLIFLPSKLLGRLCVLRLQGVLHPSTSFALVSVIYAIESAMARVMQADMTGFKMFVIYGVIHGVVNVLETLVITTVDRWSQVIRRMCIRMKGSRVTSPIPL